MYIYKPNCIYICIYINLWASETLYSRAPNPVRNLMRAENSLNDMQKYASEFSFLQGRGTVGAWSAASRNEAEKGKYVEVGFKLHGPPLSSHLRSLPMVGN